MIHTSGRSYRRSSPEGSGYWCGLPGGWRPGDRDDGGRRGRKPDGGVKKAAIFSPHNAVDLVLKMRKCLHQLKMPEANGG